MDAGDARKTPWIKRSKEERRAIYEDREAKRKAALAKRTTPKPSTPAATPLPTPQQGTPRAHTAHHTAGPDPMAAQRSINHANKTMVYDELWFLQPIVWVPALVIFVGVLVVLLVAM